MATKTFKIGLSNADKQNMAQDVYERLLALTFPEYDTSTEYSVGDFVVYNEQLYKCIGATTGAWDSSKWQLATLNDLLIDIEDAVRFVNDKANVDGNYPTMTVGVADNLSPYDESSGITQHAPFNFQASGTNNGADATATVGALTIMSEKRGNTVCVNQGINHSNMPATSTIANITITNNGDGTLTANGTQSGGALNYWVNGNYGSSSPIYNFIANHKYLISELLIFVETVPYIASNKSLGEGFIIVTPDSSFAATGIRLADVNGSISNYRFTPIIIDLTQWFNGDIPQDLLDNPDHFFRYYHGDLSLNQGTLVNANSRYLKAYGRNAFDGNNDIRVVPNSTYYIYGSATLAYKDKDGNTISSESKTNETFNIPTNCFSVGVSGDGDITISIYYEGEGGYDKHYPYELLTDNDTGSETLLAFDYKTPDGVVHKNTKVVDLATLSWTTEGDYKRTQLLDMPAWTDTSKLSKQVICQKYNEETGSTQTGDNSFSLYQRFLYIKTSETPSGSCQYLLDDEHKTTEQGIAYSENIAIDDFGTMDFSGTSGVPQGNALFYPVDYKAYLDTLHNYTDGDPAKLTLNSELNSKFESYLKSLSGYDATATQQLKNVEGTLTWVTEE